MYLINQRKGEEDAKCEKWAILSLKKVIFIYLAEK